MTSRTNQESNGVTFARMLIDISGLASKLPDWPHEVRVSTVKYMKERLDKFKIALSKRDKNSSELLWFNVEIPSVKKSLTALSKRKISEQDLHVHSLYAMEKLQCLEDIAKDMDAEDSQ